MNTQPLAGSTPLAHISETAPVILRTAASSGPDWALIAVVALAIVLAAVWLYWMHRKVQALEREMSDVVNAITVNKDRTDHELKVIKEVLNARATSRDHFSWNR